MYRAEATIMGSNVPADERKMFEPMKAPLLRYDAAESSLELACPNSDITCRTVCFVSLAEPYRDQVSL
jgi:hypothetical protein